MKIKLEEAVLKKSVLIGLSDKTVDFGATERICPYGYATGAFKYADGAISYQLEGRTLNQENPLQSLRTFGKFDHLTLPHFTQLFR